MRITHRGVSAAACAALRLGLGTVHLLTHLLLILTYYIGAHTLCRGQELYLGWEIWNTCKWEILSGASCGRALNPFQGKIKLCAPFHLQQTQTNLWDTAKAGSLREDFRQWH